MPFPSSSDDRCSICGQTGERRQCDFFIQAQNGLESLSPKMREKAKANLQRLYDIADKQNGGEGKTSVIPATLIHCNGEVTLAITNYHGPSLRNRTDISSAPWTRRMTCHTIKHAVILVKHAYSL